VNNIIKSSSSSEEESSEEEESEKEDKKTEEKVISNNISQLMLSFLTMIVCHFISILIILRAVASCPWSPGPGVV